MISYLYKKRYIGSLKEEYLYYLGFAANKRNLVRDFVRKYNMDIFLPRQYFSGMIACLLEDYWDTPLPRLELLI